MHDRILTDKTLYYSKTTQNYALKFCSMLKNKYSNAKYIKSKSSLLAATQRNEIETYFQM